MAKQRILIVGYRKAAIHAAVALGFDCVLWHDNIPPAKVAMQLSEQLLAALPPFGQPLADEIVRRVQALQITAVVAVTEKSVYAAALLREILNLPGHHAHVSVLCHDKYAMKRHARKHKIAITDFELVTEDTSTQHLQAVLGLPFIIKMRDQSGGRQLQVIHDTTTLNLKQQQNKLAERIIVGQEFSVESFVHEGTILFSNITEYYQHYAINLVPARFTAKDLIEIEKLNEHIINCYEVKTALTHVEFYLTENGLVFGEIAIRPPGGYLMELISEAYGFNAWQAFLRLMTQQTLSFSQRVQQYCAVWIIHPGSGVVAAIEGWQQLDNISSVQRYYCRVKVGDTIKTRQGSGEWVAKIFFAHATRDKLMADIELAQRQIAIILR